MARWVVPGAPLPEGKGWRIWYAQAGGEDFTPEAITVYRGGQKEDFRTTWELLPPFSHLHRRMGISTVSLSNPKPGTIYELLIPEVGSKPLVWRSMPTQLGTEGLAFLVSSCYWYNEDREGYYPTGVRDLFKIIRPTPTVKFLIGDQIYADWPPEISLNPGEKAAVEMYDKRYTQIWGDPLIQELLQLCPNLVTCDDHEYWNDFPERQFHIPWTWTAQDRETYGDVAAELFWRYQQCLNPAQSKYYSLTIGTPGGLVPPVSLFVADTRSDRQSFHPDDPRAPKSGPPHFLSEAGWQAFEQWITDLQGPGILITGQPLYQKDGDWKDHSLSNFTDDYGRFWRRIEERGKGQMGDGKRHDILLISGDIHTGRFATGTLRSADSIAVHEIITSPAARIWAPQLRMGHADPEFPPDKFDTVYNGQKRSWQVRTYRAVVDNNIALIQFYPGSINHVRINVSLYSIRPFDSRSWWERIRGEKPPRGKLALLFQRELELQ